MVVNALEYVWLLPLGIIVTLAAGIGGYVWLRRDDHAPGARVVANSTFVRELPSVRKYMARYHLLVAFGVLVVGIAAVAASVAAARPVDRSLEQPELATRDIVLCLDTSGSMLGYNQEIVDTFLELVDDFAGERIALSIWNETSRTVFPLTDDYDVVREQLTIAREAMDISATDLFFGTFTQEQEDRYFAFTAGTILDFEGENSSLIGDGLASCGLLFDQADTERSRSVLLASDNEVFGTSVFTLDEASQSVAERDVALVGLFGGDPAFGDRDGFETAMLVNGGLFYEANDPAAVPAILAAVASQQAVDLDAAAEIVIVDLPGAAFAVIAVFAALGMLITWVVKE